MDTWKRIAGLVNMLAVFVALAAAPTASFGQEQADESVLVRVNGDVMLDADAREAAVVVVQGNATIAGTAEVVVVVNGTATLTGARVTELVVVQGDAVLQEGTVIAGDVQLVNAEMTRAGDVVVEGEIRYGTGYRFGRGLLIFGLVFGIGTVLAVLLSGVIAAAVAPHSVRAAGAALTDEFGKTVLAALLIGVGLPFVAVVAFTTVIGIPTALGILFILLPALAFLGYLVAGIRLGDYVLGEMRGRDEAWHPYLAALVGLGMLLVVGWVPGLGAVVTAAAALLGAGALARHAWTTMRWPRLRRAEPTPA